MKELTLHGVQGEQTFVSRSAHRWWNRSLRRALAWGTVSALTYLLIFANAGDLTKHFSRGGIYAGAIIGVALAVTLVHSTFANYVLEFFGIRPVGKGGH